MSSNRVNDNPKVWDFVKFCSFPLVDECCITFVGIYFTSCVFHAFFTRSFYHLESLLWYIPYINIEYVYFHFPCWCFILKLHNCIFLCKIYMILFKVWTVYTFYFSKREYIYIYPRFFIQLAHLVFTLQLLFSFYLYLIN